MEPQTSRDFKEALNEPSIPGEIHLLESKRTTETMRGSVSRGGLRTPLRMPDHREIIQVREQTNELENIARSPLRIDEFEGD